MVLFLGIDGGGTGCRAAVADGSGRILGTGAAGPANLTTDPQGTMASILAATLAALDSAGLDAAAVPELVAGLGLAGANVTDGAVLGLPFARVRLETDAVAAVKGALWGGDGIVAAVGTGSVFASQRDGVIRQVGGWGLVLGDEGSGAWLGRALLARALRAVDGFVALTPLLAEVVAEHGSPAAIVAFARDARPVDFAALAQRVAGSTDPAAVAILDQAVADVAAAVALLQGEAPVPVVLLGGLAPVHAAALAERWELRDPLGSALDGALILAREAA